MIADMVQGLAPVGAPDRNRTCDLKSRSLALYPTELQTRMIKIFYPFGGGFVNA